MKTFDEIYQELQGKENSELNKAWALAKEEQQKKNKITIKVCLIIDIVILILYLFSNTTNKYGFNTFKLVQSLQILMTMFVIDIIIYAILSMVFSKKQNEYRKVYKSAVIEQIMKNFYNNLEYFPYKQMPEYIYEEGKYNEFYNRYSSDDYFEALLNNKYGVQMAEVITKKVERHTDSKGRTSTTTTLIFHGLFSKVVMEKSINSELRIMRNGKFSFDKKQLKMDSSEFEKYFDVHASNQIIGMQLLTADVMEELIEFQNKTNIKYEITINNNQLYLRFHCGAMFEPKNIKAGMLDKESLEKYFYMINFTYNLSNKLIKLIEETQI